LQLLLLSGPAAVGGFSLSLSLSRVAGREKRSAAQLVGTPKMLNPASLCSFQTRGRHVVVIIAAGKYPMHVNSILLEQLLQYRP